MTTMRIMLIAMEVYCFSAVKCAAACKSALESLAPNQTVKVALIQYEMNRPSSVEQWEQKIYQYVLEAARGGASYVLFPELISIEGLSLVDPTGADPAQAMRDVAKELTPRLISKMSEWSREFSITLIGSTWPVIDASGKVHNTAMVFGPNGFVFHTQQKNHLTHDEVSLYRLAGSKCGCRPFRLGEDVDAAIAVCFDSEFPNYIPAD